MEYSNFDQIQEKLNQSYDITRKYMGNAHPIRFLGTPNTDWDELNTILLSNIESCETYKGLDPLSEEYSQAIENYVRNILPSIAERIGWCLNYLNMKIGYITLYVLFALPVTLPILLFFSII